MKRGNVLCALMMTTLFCGWMTVLPRAVAAQEQAQQESPWKDRAEYDAFNTMAQATDPNQQVELADKYLADYPETNFADKVQEFKLQAYQKLNDSGQIQATATKLLEVKPDHFHALYLLSYLMPRTIDAQDPAMGQKLDRASEYARRGLQGVGSLPKPEGLSDPDFQKQKDQATAVFHQTSGFVALQKKDYSQAERELRQSAEMNPTDSLGFYWLGLAYLSPKPAQHDPGMWALARAVSITGPNALPPATKSQVRDYLDQVYDARHGSTEGLEEVLAQASASPFPPPDFHVMTVEESPEYIAQQEALRQEELRQEAQKRRQLAQFTRGHERKKLSEELHDDTLASLASINMELGLLAHEAKRISSDLEARISGVHQLVRESDRRLRDIVHGIFPSVLTNLGLAPAVRTYLEELSQRPIVNPAPLQIEFRASGFGSERLPDNLEVVLYPESTEGHRWTA